MLVYYFKVILPDHLFMLCRRFTAPLLHALRRLLPRALLRLTRTLPGHGRNGGRPGARAWFVWPCC